MGSSAHRLLRLLLAAVAVHTALQACSPGVLPQPPPGSKWDPLRSAARCTSWGRPAVCPAANLGCDCGWTGAEGTACDGERDDATACDCFCCCPRYPSDGAACGWGAGRYHSALAAGSLLPGEVCTAVCQPGFAPTAWNMPFEAFTCDGATGQLEPDGHSSFACVAAKDSAERPCSESPPCEGSGCEWEASCTSPGMKNGACVAQCRTGYVSSQAPMKYYCVDLGNDWKWSAVTPLSCALACPGLPPLLHQHWRTGGANDIASCGAAPYSDQRCKVGCDAGFHLADGADPNCGKVTSNLPLLVLPRYFLTDCL